MAKDKVIEKKLQEVLSRMAPSLQMSFLDYVAVLAGRISVSIVAQLIAEKQVDEILRRLRLGQDSDWSDFYGYLTEAIAAGGAVVASSIPKGAVIDPYTGDEIAFTFNGRSPQAEAWARTRLADLIVEVSDDQKAMVRSVIERGLASGQDPKSLALDLVGRLNRATGMREGGFIGLTNYQAGIVNNVKYKLDSLSSGYFDYALRDKRFDKTIRQAIEDGTPLSEAYKQKVLQAYRQRLLKYRGEVIARTETLDALRSGKDEAFRQLIESGDLIEGATITITWHTTLDGRERPSHDSLNGVKVRYGEYFNPRPGVYLAYPGDRHHSPGNSKGLAAETIQCRCHAEYNVEYDK